MNAKSTLHGHLAELTPFANEVTVNAPKRTTSVRTAARRECIDNASAIELYGCVDWYQYREHAAINVVT
jgi:hypothetical protein